MKKQTKWTVIACISLAIGLIAVGVVYFVGKGSSGELLDAAARREFGVPDDGIIYIEPNMSALAAELSGTVESKAASKAAFDALNATRVANGMKPLKWSSGLEKASAVRAVEATQVWSHTRPNGSDYYTVDSSLVYGENLAQGYTTANSAMDAWMASPAHKDNILFPDFVTGAISINVSGGQWVWACEFGY